MLYCKSWWDHPPAPTDIHCNHPDEACMSLCSLNLPLLLRLSDHDLIANFYAPALNYAFCYDRGVGYFVLRSSLQIAAITKLL